MRSDTCKCRLFGILFLISVIQPHIADSLDTTSIDNNLYDSVITGLTAFDRSISVASMTLQQKSTQVGIDDPARTPHVFDQKTVFKFNNESLYADYEGAVLFQGEDGTIVEPRICEISFHEGTQVLLEHTFKSVEIRNGSDLTDYNIVHPRYFFGIGEEGLSQYIINNRDKIESVGMDTTCNLARVSILTNTRPDVTRRHIVWLDTTKGMIPVRQEITVTTPESSFVAYRSEMFDIEQLPNGTWFPKRAVTEMFRDRGSDILLRRDIEFQDVDLDYRPTEEDFNVNIPAGYYVKDMINNFKYYKEDIINDKDVEIAYDNVYAEAEEVLSDKQNEAARETSKVVESGEQAGTAQGETKNPTMGFLSRPFLACIAVFFAVLAVGISRRRRSRRMEKNS